MKKRKILIQVMSYFLIFLLMMIIIPFHLFPCFSAVFLSYEIIISLTPFLRNILENNIAKLFIITCMSIMIIIFIFIIIIYLEKCFILYSKFNFAVEINNIIYNVKNILPEYIVLTFPDSYEEIRKKIIFIIESNFTYIINIIRNFIYGFITSLIGIVIGAMISFNTHYDSKKYFIQQIKKRLYYISKAFRNIVFAQIRISFVNTILTAIMLFIIMPFCKIYIPFSTILIIITFIFGLLPIIGNLISNFIICISTISVSITMGCIMILYLVLIHKLEYFLNAKIIGNKINAQAWELLLIMLIFESIFGIEGLIAAPVYYAYLKYELKAKNLI